LGRSHLLTTYSQLPEVPRSSEEIKPHHTTSGSLPARTNCHPKAYQNPTTIKPRAQLPLNKPEQLSTPPQISPPPWFALIVFSSFPPFLLQHSEWNPSHYHRSCLPISPSTSMSAVHQNDASMNRNRQLQLWMHTAYK
jgi:hypothetical protein